MNQLSHIIYPSLIIKIILNLIHVGQVTAYPLLTRENGKDIDTITSSPSGNNQLFKVAVIEVEYTPVQKVGLGIGGFIALSICIYTIIILCKRTGEVGEVGVGGVGCSGCCMLL
ncbi:982_t:CDS:2 [Entrophospora sp. SA101]|nr:982_t:CDS:2 [Entrophospora sp. SA101]CAJ0920048.1 9873_t:CDS:2 [Entrophospora sp. SA101]